MKKISNKKSGFQEGRSKTGPSRSSTKKNKNSEKPEAQRTKIENKLKKAKDDLADTLRDMDVGGFVFDGEDAVDENGENVSRFASDFGLIRKGILRSGEEFNADAAHKLILKTQLAMFLELQPLAEVAFRNSKKEQAAYAAIAVAEQIKSISTELKMIGNVESQASFIREKIIQPIYMALLQNMMQQFMSVKQTVDTELGGTKAAESGKEIKRSLDKGLKALGSFLDASRDGMSANIHAYLSGDMSFMASGSDGQQAALGKRRRGSKNRGQ